MKRSLLIFSLLLSSLFAQAVTPSPAEPDTRVLRINGMIDPEVENDDADLNLEVAAGVAVAPFNELGILIGHMDSGYADTTEVLFYAEDTYDVGLPVLPYASAGIGYAWSKTDTEDVNSMFGELEAGVKYMVTDHHALGIGAEFSYSLEDIYLDKNGVGDDHNIEFGASFSYYY